MERHAKLKITALVIGIMLMLPIVADALSGTYVVLTKGGGGLAMFFSEKGTFTSIARSGRDKQKHYGKGKYTVSGDKLTIKTSNGVIGTMTIERNGQLYESRTNSRLHSYNSHTP